MYRRFAAYDEESLVYDIGRACLMVVGYKSRWWARCNHVCDKFGR